jgi:hypothetical protein
VLQSVVVVHVDGVSSWRREDFIGVYLFGHKSLDARAFVTFVDLAVVLDLALDSKVSLA